VKVVDGNGIVAAWALVEALVRPVVVAMALVLVEDGASESFVVDQEPGGALGANAADESLGIAIRLRDPDRDLGHVEAFEGEDGVVAQDRDLEVLAWVRRCGRATAASRRRCQR
jgi:hypothetical protein